MKKVDLKEAYNHSYYTILGADGDLQEWVDEYEKMLKEEGIGKPLEWFTCKGKDVNTEFNLQGNNKFQNNLTLLFFKLDGLAIGKLSIFKVRMGDRWFDDVIDNSVEESEDEE